MAPALADSPNPNPLLPPHVLKSKINLLRITLANTVYHSFPKELQHGENFIDGTLFAPHFSLVLNTSLFGGSF